MEKGNYGVGIGKVASPSEAAWDEARFFVTLGADKLTLANGRFCVHKECLFDFAGNVRQPGIWADLWETNDDPPEERIFLGGGWDHYLDGAKAGPWVTGEDVGIVKNLLQQASDARGSTRDLFSFLGKLARERIVETGKE